MEKDEEMESSETLCQLTFISRDLCISAFKLWRLYFGLDGSVKVQMKVFQGKKVA